MSEIWNEKYRPKVLDDVIGLPNGIKELVGSAMPHMLFVGPAGTGKTTTARIIIKEMGGDALELNSSDERGIGTIQDKVKGFASSMSMAGKMRIVFLDESDGLTKDAQNALRNMMEKYHKNCRFILTANYLEKVTTPLKSRCATFEFTTPNKKSIELFMIKILTENELNFTQLEPLQKIIDDHYPDIRSCINALQKSIKEDKVVYEGKQFIDSKKLFTMLKEKRLKEIRQFLRTDGLDIKALLVGLSDEVIDSELPIDKKKEMFEAVCDANRGLGLGWIPRLELENLCLKLVKVME